MIGRAAATGLPGRGERVRDAAAAADERPGQGRRNIGSAPPDHGAGTPNSARSGRGSPRATGRSWRHCCTGCRQTCSAGCGCWCARTRCCAGTATWWHAPTPPSPVRSARDGRGPCTPSGPWWCGWLKTIPAGGIARHNGRSTRAGAAYCWQILHIVHTRGAQQPDGIRLHRRPATLSTGMSDRDQSQDLLMTILR
jgi:hypothetical protein